MNITGYDFSGWATRPNLRCSDGRVIMKDAFKDDNGRKVPLVYNHIHDSMSQVLGHAILEEKDGGIYAYAFLNNSKSGNEAREAVKHGDITSFSIYANQLRESGKNVIHGMIRELSIVLAGANPGAVIEDVLAHSDEFDGEALIDIGYDNAEILSHAADDEKKEEEKESMAETKETKETKEPEEKETKSEEKTIGEVINTLTDEQKKAVAIVIGQAIADAKGDKDEDDEDEKKVAHSDISDDLYERNDYAMKHNIFEGQNDDRAYVSREDQAALLQHAFEARTTLKQAVLNEMRDGGVLAHAITDHNGNSITYGVANIDYLFPDARSLNNPPDLISNNQDWVNKVINGTHHTPFSRVKSLFADITGADARARGYVKGNQKVNEVIEALKRETTPQTIYKKQKLDRDDIIDITDFDVVAWLKAEMQLMLKAEIARAILIGDGREAGNDKIKEANVRPIYNDNDVYTVKVPVSVANTATDADVAAALIDAMILSRKDYKGSGNPTFFVSEDYLGQMLILKDGMGRRIYETEASLAAALRVKEIVPVDVMENQTIAIPTGVGTATADKPFIGLIVNLQDYNVGADKGGATSFFDDFDIDYNQYAYLYETRMSGALIKPKSAMSFYVNRAGSATT